MLNERLKELRKEGYSNVYCKKTRRFTAGFKGNKICEADTRDEATQIIIKHKSHKKLEEKLYELEMKKILEDEYNYE